MNAPVNGIDLLIVLIVTGVLLVAWTWGSWKSWDNDRRLKRRLHVNSVRARRRS